MGSAGPVRILIIEDSESDLRLLREAFAELAERRPELAHAGNLSEGMKRLAEATHDVVLLDLGLPDSQGMETFTRLHSTAPEVPVVVLTSLDDEGTGAQAMKLGAQDYLMKHEMRPATLARSLRYAIERQRATADSVRSRQKLRQLTVRLQEVREAERTHIAREVHDELGQMLTALKMDLRWMERKLAQPEDRLNLSALSNRISESGKLVDRTIETVQRIALELRPSVLDHLGLGEAIRDEARRFEARTGISISVELPEGLPAISREATTAFFRVFQELLTNVARHAAAQHVRVTLTQSHENLTMTVSDDGKGLPADALSDRASLGLLGMSERAISMGGQLNFEGVPDSGTRATLEVPITGILRGQPC